MEHVLFLGSKKYSGQSEFDDFISSNAGGCQAITFSDYTLYYFTVKSSMLRPALERFSALIKEPLFNEDCLKREVCFHHNMPPAGCFHTMTRN
jgi:insulysin